MSKVLKKVKVKKKRFYDEKLKNISTKMIFAAFNIIFGFGAVLGQKFKMPQKNSE